MTIRFSGGPTYGILPISSVDLPRVKSGSSGRAIATVPSADSTHTALHVHCTLATGRRHSPVASAATEATRKST